MQEERQANLRDRARRLIAETRTRSMNFESPTSPVKSITHRITLSPERTISPINNADGFGFASSKSSNSKENSPTKHKSNHSSPPRVTPPRDAENNHSTSSNQNSVLSERNGNSPSLQSFNSVVESLSPQHDKKVRIVGVDFGEILVIHFHLMIFIIFPVICHLQISYIQSELDALEREQEAIDLKARACEKRLRHVMNGSSTSNPTFLLLNCRNEN